MSDPADRWSVSLEGTTLLGRYTVERKLGGGGMASVYLASDDQLEMPVVVKVPHTAYLAEAGFRERFERETRDLISLQHPHIVRILARGEHEGLPFLVMQFLPGGSLGDRIRAAKGKPLGLTDVQSWLRDLCRALDFIHAQGVVHRDIKPDNVLFDDYGHAYLSDFGIAKAVGGADTGLTVTGTTPGSPAYMAPEQPRQSSLTGASDQYSLAATVYEALAGRPTHEGETAVDVLLKKQTEMPPVLHEIAPDVPAVVSAAVMRALQRDPEERWPTCDAMVEAFTGPEAAAAPPPPTPPPPEPVATEAPRPAGGGSLPGGTFTLSGSSRRTVWMVLTVLCLGLPLLLLFSDSGEDADRGGGGLDMARERGGKEARQPSDEVPPTRVKTVPPQPAPPLAEAQALAGTWVVDREALQQRLKAMRPDRRRPPRFAPPRKEIERALKGGMQLVLERDGAFELSFQVPDPKRPEPIAGTYQVVDEIVVFRPDPERIPAGKKMAGEPFQGRLREGRLHLVRRSFEVPLKRR